MIDPDRPALLSGDCNIWDQYGSLGVALIQFSSRARASEPFSVDGIRAFAYCFPVAALFRQAGAPTATASRGASENRTANPPILPLCNVRYPHD